MSELAINLKTSGVQNEIERQPLDIVRNILTRPKVSDNIIFNADSYKIGHWMFMEENTTYTTAYMEARAGAEFDETTLWGFQYHLLNEDFIKPVTQEMIDQADEIISNHGLPINLEGWKYIVEEHGGYLPIRISAVREGVTVPTGNILVKIESTDTRFNAAWAAMFIETKWMRTWYPITITTLSRQIKKVINNALVRTGDESTTAMKLVDFGSRGVATREQSMVGGAAHLINFEVTDNLLGMATLIDFYTVDGKGVPALSIPATEHTETILWGRDREFHFYNNIVQNILPKTGICSVVIDTYNTERAIEMFGSLRKDIEAAGTIVFRPDSGDPVEMTEMVVKKLDELFGPEVNEKGFKVLNPCARIIQGDGVCLESVKAILDNFERLGYSADNITFGSGGALLQKVNRDTMRFAIKGSHGVVGGDARDIQKVPATDMTKASKAGILRLVRNEKTGEFRTINQHIEADADEVDMLEPVFENGKILRWQSLEEIRALAAL